MSKFNNQFATQKLRQEMSVTSTGAGMTPSTVNNPVTQDWYTTKNKKKVKKEEEQKDVEPKLAAGKATVYMKDKWGWKDAPSIPNRPSKGGFMYSQIFEELSNFVKENKLNIKSIGDFNYNMSMLGLAAQQMRDEQMFNTLAKLRSQTDLKSAETILDDIKSKIKTHKTLDKSIKIDALKAIENIRTGYETINEAVNRVHIGTDRPGGDKEIYYDQPPGTGTFWVNIIDKAGNRWNKLQVNTIDDVIAKFPSFSWTEKGIEMFPEFEPEEQDDDEDKFNWYTGDYELNESYSKFKTETKTRGKSDQFHQAVREVRRKVQEINRLFEYVSRLKTELSEGEGGLKYKMHTEKALAKIKEMVSELNQNIKKFK